MVNGFRRLRRIVMVVTTGRSGSVFVTNLINQNALNASSEHEPDLVPVDVSARWYYEGDREKLARLAAQKLARLRNGDALAGLPGGGLVRSALTHRIARRRFNGYVPTVPVREVYVEVNNAFVKSFGPAFIELVPSVELIHLIRDPLEVARSAVNRGSQPNPERPYYLWPSWRGNELTLDESVACELSGFQLALWYWLEMELRYEAVCRRYPHVKTFEVDLATLNSQEGVRKMFDAHGITHRALTTAVDRHRGGTKNLVTEQDKREARELLARIPPDEVSRLPATFGIEHL